MNDDEAAETARLREMVIAIMDVTSRTQPTMLGGRAIDAQDLLNAFQYITAAMIEAHPDVRMPRDLREAAELQGAAIFRWMKEMRGGYERTGVRVWDTLNVPLQ
jgi:hypothetical protein